MSDSDEVSGTSDSDVQSSWLETCAVKAQMERRRRVGAKDEAMLTYTALKSWLVMFASRGGLVALTV